MKKLIVAMTGTILLLLMAFAIVATKLMDNTPKLQT